MTTERIVLDAWAAMMDELRERGIDPHAESNRSLVDALRDWGHRDQMLAELQAHGIDPYADSNDALMDAVDGWCERASKSEGQLRLAIALANAKYRRRGA